MLLWNGKQQLFIVIVTSESLFFNKDIKVLILNLPPAHLPLDFEAIIHDIKFICWFPA